GGGWAGAGGRVRPTDAAGRRAPPLPVRIIAALTNSRYAAAGVDIDAKSAALARARSAIRSTFTPAVLGDVGGFGGLYRPDFSGYREPVLVASTDGVGTKLKVAVAAGGGGTPGGGAGDHRGDDNPGREGQPAPFFHFI